MPKYRPTDTTGQASPTRIATRGERKERDNQQDEQVDAQEDLVRALEPFGQCGVTDPGRTDRQEADEVPEIARPRVQHLPERRTGRVDRDVEEAAWPRWRTPRR